MSALFETTFTPPGENARVGVRCPCGSLRDAQLTGTNGKNNDEQRKNAPLATTIRFFFAGGSTKIRTFISASLHTSIFFYDPSISDTFVLGSNLGDPI